MRNFHEVEQNHQLCLGQVEEFLYKIILRAPKWVLDLNAKESGAIKKCACVKID